MDPRSSRLDRRTTLLLVACVALASGGAVLGDAASLAVFLRRVGSTQLPAVLALSALFSAVLGLLWVRLVAAHPLTRAGVGAMGCIPPVVTGLALAVRLDVPHSPWGLSIVAHAIGTLEPVILWGIAGAMADVRDAKTLFPRLAGASVAGAAVGGGLTIVLARVGAGGLLLTWASLATGAWALLRVVVRDARPEPDEPEEAGLGDGGTALRGFLRWMCTAAVLLGALAVAVDYVYSRAVEARFGTEEDTAAFVGVMDGVVTLVSLAISALVTPRLVQRRGVIAGILGQPVMQVLGFGLLALLPGFPVVVGLSVVHRSWLGGATAPAYNAALFVVPPAGRERLRTVLELICIPGGAVLAGVALAVGAERVSARSQHLAAIAAAGLTIAALVAARREYQGAWKEALRQGLSHLLAPAGRAARALVAVDWSAEQHLAARVGLSSGDESLRQVSASFLAENPRVEDRAALLEALEDPSTRVRAGVVRALAHLVDPEVRARLEPLLSSPDTELVVAVLEALERAPGELGPEVGALLVHPAPEVAIAAARALLARSPDAAARRALLTLASRPAEVACVALEAIARYPFAEAGDVARSGLGSVGTQEASCRALAAVDPEGAPPLLIALLPSSTPHRRAVISECLSRLGPSAGALLQQSAEDPVTGGPALLALALHPGSVPIPALRRLARARHARFGSLVTAGDVLQSEAAQRAPSPAMRVLRASVVEETQALAVEIIAAACAGAESSAVADVLEALHGQDRDLWAHALEVAEGLADPALIEPVLAWRDDERSLGRLPDLDDTLRVLRQDPSPWLQELARACDRLEPPMKTSATLPVLERVVALQQIPLFRELSIADLRVLAGLLTEELFADGEVIGRQGERGDRMHFVHSGEVAVRLDATADQAGREIAVRRSGDHVGEMSLLDDSPRMATMVAVGSTRTLAMTRAHFRRLATERPTILLTMMGVLAERLREATRMGSARG